MTGPDLGALAAAVRRGDAGAEGTVLGVRGMAIRVSTPAARIGGWLRLGGDQLAEIVGFDGVEAVALPLTRGARLHAGMTAVQEVDEPAIPAGDGLLGRVLNALGAPMDRAGALPVAPPWPIHRAGPNPLERRPVVEALSLGVRAIDGLFTVGAGQRLGLHAGPGAGKTTLLAQIAAQAAADVVVVGLIGERGREVGAFLDRLPAGARARTVVVVARADDPPLSWIRAAEVATAVSEHFRDAGRSVLLLVDSLTRVARAVRAVGVAAGEPTTRRGFPASLSTAIAALVERAGNDARGALSAVYAVLVEGADGDDPVAEEARALLDGHLVLDGALAEAGRFPALDVRRSVSRCMEAVVDAEHGAAAATVRRWLAALDAHRDLVAVGAYREGADADVDAARRHAGALEAFLRQGPTEGADPAATRARLLALVR